MYSKSADVTLRESPYPQKNSSGKGVFCKRHIPLAVIDELKCWKLPHSALIHSILYDEDMS